MVWRSHDILKIPLRLVPSVILSRAGLLAESIENILAGDTETGKIILRDTINATIGFEKLMHMLSPSGNPTAKNLFGKPIPSRIIFPHFIYRG